MNINKKKGFTLIELIAVLVIMAILALIVTPLVMNIIRKARISADKRSIDAYGRSIELAIATYLLDIGRFPTDINQLTIEYSGSEVVCSQAQLNSDSSVYLAGCRVAGRSVGDYEYGKLQVATYDTYSVGDEVSYNNVGYYVIKDSGATESTVTLLKAEPLTVDEINLYGAGRINRYTRSSVGTAYNYNGYGAIVYYSSENCGYINDNLVEAGCTTDYSQSDVKYVVDAWKNAQAPLAIEARLIQYNEFENLGYVEGNITSTTTGMLMTENTPNWVYNSNYLYWTMSPYQDSESTVWVVRYDGAVIDSDVYYYFGDYTGSGVRPVITISKSEI